MQFELDEHIKQKHGLTHKNLLEEKHLALIVELGELANETRCFKYWSTKDPSERASILEEYVDGVYFILSLGLDKGYRYNKVLTKSESTSVTQQFNIVFDTCTEFRKEPTREHYDDMVTTYLQLGHLLGFSEEDIQ